MSVWEYEVVRTPLHGCFRRSCRAREKIVQGNFLSAEKSIFSYYQHYLFSERRPTTSTVITNSRTAVGMATRTANVDMVLVMGLSGAGKSYFINCLTGALAGSEDEAAVGKRLESCEITCIQ